MDDILLALLANGFIIVQLGQDTLVADATINAVNAGLHPISIKNQLWSIFWIPLVPGIAQQYCVGITSAHESR